MDNKSFEFNDNEQQKINVNAIISVFQKWFKSDLITEKELSVLINTLNRTFNNLLMSWYPYGR